MKDSGSTPGNMIGQFGVGFYSAFMVADQVKVHTRSWQKDGQELVWISDGKSGYEIEESPGQPQPRRDHTLTGALAFLGAPGIP